MNEKNYVERKVEGIKPDTSIESLDDFYRRNHCEMRFEVDKDGTSIYLKSSKETFDLFTKLFC